LIKICRETTFLLSRLGRRKITTDNQNHLSVISILTIIPSHILGPVITYL